MEKQATSSGSATFDSTQIVGPAFFYYHRLRRVQEYVQEHYSERVTLDRAAQVAGMERTYFSRFFHEKSGVRFTDWLTFIRVSHAKEMLTAQNAPITRVAMSVGYRDLRTFERAFHRCEGITPSAFKNSVRPS